MGVDPRQVLAGVLTITMFVMLGDMIKRDHFDSLPGDSETSIHGTRKQSVVSDGVGAWKEDGESLKACWTKPVLDDADESQGFVTFSLTNGPEYHVSQIADALVVARYLRATLLLPDIRGSEPDDKRKFEHVYDVDHFINSLDGVVKVAKSKPPKFSERNVALVKVPSRVTEEHIADNIEPIFRAKGNIRLATYFPSVNMKQNKENSNIDSIACLGMFGTLKLQPQLSGVVESMLERLTSLSKKSNGQFIAVDLRVDMLEKKGCQGNGAKSCYGPQDIAMFLRKIGFNKDTTIYLTQSRWHNSLDAFKHLFPRTYTKESIMPVDKKARFLDTHNSQLEKVIDFSVCSQSHVFVPAISGLFYANVAGKRIASGKTQILVPAHISASSASSTDYTSHYISKKNHFAYTCFC